MKTYYKMIKKWDVIIIIALVLFSFLPVGIFAYQQTGTVNAGSELIAVISVENEVIEEIPLTSHEGTEVFDIVSKDNDTNTIEVKEGQIRIKAATCPDQVCVLTGFVSRPGETIVCLPHKLVIEVQAADGHSDDMIISS